MNPSSVKNRAAGIRGRLASSTVTDYQLPVVPTNQAITVNPSLLQWARAESGYAADRAGQPIAQLALGALSTNRVASHGVAHDLSSKLTHSRQLRTHLAA
jgi:hypothetical protein